VENLKMIADEAIELLKDLIKDAEKIPFNCILESSLITAQIMNANKNAQFAFGDLSYQTTILFKHDVNFNFKDLLSSNSYDGHAWVECDGFIIDSSIFRTLYYGEKIPKNIKDCVVKQFGHSRGRLIAKKEEILKNYGFNYALKGYLPINWVDEYNDFIIKHMSHLGI
jgi:hypothetical protein